MRKLNFVVKLIAIVVFSLAAVFLNAPPVAADGHCNDAYMNCLFWCGGGNDPCGDLCAYEYCVCDCSQFRDPVDCRVRVCPLLP